MESPGYEVIRRHAVADAQALRNGGADGVILENFGDAPFTKSRVSAYTVAIMSRLAHEVRSLIPDLKLGINILRNDAMAALGVATASEADFIRVNVFTGVTATDQGIIEGEARELHFERRRLNASVQFAADVHVKHGSPMYNAPIDQTAEDTFKRGRADAIILSGHGTGMATPTAVIQQVRKRLPEAPIWIGSGFEPSQRDTLVGAVDAVIVGTWLRHGDLSRPIDVERVRLSRAALTP